jgi:hypothetical protein
MSNEVTIQTAEIPSGYCFQGLASDWPFLISLLTARLDGTLNTINLGNSVPAAAQRGSPWLRTFTDGSPDRWYSFSNGYWLAQHPALPGQVILWGGDIATINTFDGGEVATVGPMAGPMWERIAELDGKFPIGPGTLASTAVVSAGDTGGEEKHQLVLGELPKHTPTPASGDTIKTLGGPYVGAEGSINRNGSMDYKPISPFTEIGGDLSHNNMPPYFGIYFIRRTARLYYRI